MAERIKAAALAVHGGASVQHGRVEHAAVVRDEHGISGAGVAVADAGVLDQRLQQRRLRRRRRRDVLAQHELRRVPATFDVARGDEERHRPRTAEARRLDVEEQQVFERGVLQLRVRREAYQRRADDARQITEVEGLAGGDQVGGRGERAANLAHHAGAAGGHAQGRSGQRLERDRTAAAWLPQHLAAHILVRVDVAGVQPAADGGDVGRHRRAQRTRRARLDLANERAQPIAQCGVRALSSDEARDTRAVRIRPVGLDGGHADASRSPAAGAGSSRSEAARMRSAACALAFVPAPGAAAGPTHPGQPS